MNPIEIEELDKQETIEIEGILNRSKSENGNIITILQDIQKNFGYLPAKYLFYVSRKLKISLAKIYSIATFYTQFKFTPKGKYNIICCEGTACHVKGGALILDFIENKLNIKSGEITEDKMFSIESVACLGCCAISPVCIINDKIYGNLTIKKIRKIIKNLMKETNKGNK
ncbi:MAG: NAD(P)H-dependent oxidoreductase subunit E [Candidatus Lokiarchaeota archaeon]|nr:NAD(P)H-dependent oxidoreductase subunit E [Candidatus Lokiarchaeota archaeon]